VPGLLAMRAILLGIITKEIVNVSFRWLPDFQLRV
jgi:hypothetical protein